MTQEERESIESETKRLQSKPQRTGWETLALAILEFQLRKEQQVIAARQADTVDRLVALVDRLTARN